MSCENPLECKCPSCLENAKLRSDYYAQRFMYERDAALYELDEAKEMLLKATQMLNYIQFRSDYTWKHYPFHMVNTLLVELPKIPNEDDA